MKKEIEHWRGQSGLNYFQKPNEDPLKLAIELSTNINNVSIEELDETLMVLANYHSYLSSQVGILIARVSYLEETFNYKIDLASSEFSAPSAAERKAMAISSYPEFSTMKAHINKEKTKLSMVKPVMDSVRTKIETLKKIYERRGRNVS